MTGRCLGIAFLALAGCEFWAARGAAADLKLEAASAAYGIKHFTTENGLPQNTVRCLIQSRDGYLWIGTSAGVARYDGMKFTAYSTEVLASDAGDTRILDLGEDGEGCIWVRTGEGLACFSNGQWKKYRCIAAPLTGTILTSCTSREGGLWLAMADGVKRFQGGRITRTFSTEQGLSDRRAGVLREDGDGYLWIGFGGPLTKLRWQRLDPRTGTISELSALLGPVNEAPTDIVADRSEVVWACSPTELVSLIKSRVTHYPSPVTLAGRELIHINRDDSGALWLIARGDRQVFRFQDGACSAVDLPGLRSTDLRCVLVDREGLIWIGTGDEGLLQLKPRQFSSLLTENSEGQRIEIFSICPGQEGKLWFGTSEGLFRLQNGVFTRFTNAWMNPQGKFEQSVRAVVEDRTGTVWFGVKDEGLKRLRDGQFVQEPGAACGSTGTYTVGTLLEDQRGSLWIGSERGLVQRTPEGRFSRISTKLGFSDERINGIQEARDGRLWVGTIEGGLYELRENWVRRFTTREGLSSDDARPLRIEDNDAVWVSTPKGLNRLRDGNVQTVTMQRGLFDNEIYSLLEDTHGYYWATCNRGVFRMPKSELDAIGAGSNDWLDCASFGEEDGLASSECNGEAQPNAASTDGEHLWFSTTRGCATVDANELLPRQVPPQIVIEEVLADYQTIFKEGSVVSAENEVEKPGELRLPAGRARVVEIRYTANSFLSPAKVRFQHRLQGHDSAWRDAGNRRVAFYTDLAPGRYKFEVKACTDQGIWSSKSAGFAFELAPHVWQTWTFYVMTGATVIGFGAMMQGNRLRWQRRLLKLEEQRALANERARIARDLHDDLGTALTGLALELDVAGRRDNKEGPSVTERLSQTAKHARDLAERMREVVWTVNPSCDTVSSLADFLEQQAEQFLQLPGLRVRLQFPDDIPALPLNAKARHHLALCVREALSNVVRHAQATEVSVSLQLLEDLVVVEVKDNGRGFQPIERSGHGLSNLRTRMEEIGGNFQCQSQLGTGTVVSFHLPLARQHPGKERSQ